MLALQLCKQLSLETLLVKVGQDQANFKDRQDTTDLAESGNYALWLPSLSLVGSLHVEKENGLSFVFVRRAVVSV